MEYVFYTRSKIASRLHLYYVCYPRAGVVSKTELLCKVLKTPRVGCNRVAYNIMRLNEDILVASNKNVECYIHLAGDDDFMRCFVFVNRRVLL